MIVSLAEYRARRECGNYRPRRSPERQKLPHSDADYRAIMDSLRGIQRVRGSETDPLVSALLAPARAELLARAEALAPSARMFAADKAIIARCKAS